MEIITKVIDDFIDIPHNHFVFDIETTGLSHKYNKVILIGIMYNSNNQTIIKQFFASRESEEKEILVEFISSISKFSNHISFNGISFDIPFLNARFKKYDINFSLDKINDYDILRFVKHYKDVLSLENYKLKTIEKLLGIKRLDTISGKESIDLYKEFIQTNHKDIKSKILLHNYEDIYYLGKLLKIKELLEEKLDLLSIPMAKNVIKILPSSYKIISNTLITNYSLFSGELDLLELFSDDYYININKDSICVKLSIRTGFDNNDNKVSFYNLNSIIPLKFNNDYLEENIYTLCNYILKKELSIL